MLVLFIHKKAGCMLLPMTMQFISTGMLFGSRQHLAVAGIINMPDLKRPYVFLPQAKF